MSECFICGDTFNLHNSHDIPKYIGGKDSDGITILCAIHHRQYDLFLLREFLKTIGDFPILDYYMDIIKWQSAIKKNKSLHKKFMKIAKNVRSYYFNSNIRNKEYTNHYCLSCESEIDIEDKICPNCFKIINSGDGDGEYN